MSYEDRNLALAFGVLADAEHTVQAFNGTSAEVTLEKECLYRLVATEPCFVSVGGTGEAATTSSIYLPGDTIDFTSTDKTNIYLNVIQVSGGGNLHITKLKAHTNKII